MTRQKSAQDNRRRAPPMTAALLRLWERAEGKSDHHDIVPGQQNVDTMICSSSTQNRAVSNPASIPPQLFGESRAVVSTHTAARRRDRRRPLRPGVVAGDVHQTGTVAIDSTR
jgi:hypothetical protein